MDNRIFIDEENELNIYNKEIKQFKNQIKKLKENKNLEIDK